MATSAPSLAKAMATARPMPESPPVMRATRLASLPEPLCLGSCALGLGRMVDSWPGGCWVWGLRMGLGWDFLDICGVSLVVGAGCKSGASGVRKAEDGRWRIEDRGRRGHRAS